MSNYQTDSLYSFLNMSNPATKAVTECYSGFVEVWSGLDAKLDIILSKLSGDIMTDTGTTTWTGSSWFNNIIFPTKTGTTIITTKTWIKTN